MINDKWDYHFFNLAKQISLVSKDPSTKVGALIVDTQRRMLGSGYNGFPRGVLDLPERYLDKMVKYKLVVHSEANAILNSTASIVGCTMYSTKYPCSDCAKLIIQSGILRVVTIKPSADAPWAEDAEFSKQMFFEAGVCMEFVE